MTSAIAYTLSALHLLCHLVFLQTTGIDAVSVLILSPPDQHQSEDSLSDYVPYPDIGFAYKVHYQSVSWIDAKNLCIKDHAQLASIDSMTKYKYVTNQRTSPGSTHVGIIRMYDDTMWVSVSTGSPVSSLPWASDEPFGEQDCVMMSGDGRGLVNHSCDVKSNYVCELPIHIDNSITPV